MARIHNGTSYTIKVPLDGNGSDIVDGALITPGVTAGTDMGVFIKSGAAGADVLGCLVGLHDFSVVGDSTPEDGLAHVLGEVEVYRPGDLLEIEYDLTSTITADGGSSSTTLTITSLEDNIDSSWIYVVSGDAIGLLAYVDASASGSCTLKTAPATAIGTSDEVIKILRLGHTLLFLNSNTDKLGSQAAVGTFRFNVLRNQVSYKGSQGWEDLNPTKHDNLTGLDTKFPKFRAIGSIADAWFNPIA